MGNIKRQAIILALIIFLQLSCGFIQAQPLEIKIQEIEGTEYMVPTTELLVRFLNWRMDEWEAAMIGLGYSCATGKEDVHRPVYLKGKNGDMVVGISKNTLLKQVSFDWYNYKNKKSLMNDFISSIKPYYLDRKNGIDYYVYKDWLIGIQKEDNDTLYHESVSILRKP